jgi:hypothetical protein
MSYVSGGFLHRSNYNRVKRYSCLAVSWNVWGFHELGLFWRVSQSNYDWKKGTVVWPSVAMSDCFGGFVTSFSAGFSIKLQVAVEC